ncbi:MAG: hypothetical protein H8E37_12995 [Planctomycetes bacterium]|nr:hypothetical protein [Planctomycetota bacterium]
MTSRIDQLRRFERLGLKWNPFRVVTPAELCDVYVPDLYETLELAAQVAASGAAITQIIAPAGHGKSTFLSAVAEALDEASIPFESIYLQPSLRTRVPVPQTSLRVLILDEAERLTSRNLRRLAHWTATGPRLVVSSHRDLSASLPGAEARTIRLPGVSRAGLLRLFLARLRWASSDEKKFELTGDAADWLIEVSRGNLRVIQAVLYESFQATADEFARHPDGLEARPQPLVIDAPSLNWLETFAVRRAAEEEAGNIPFSRLRLIGQAVTATKGKIAALLSGRASTPDPDGPRRSTSR